MVVPPARPPRDLSATASGLAPLSVTPSQWTVPLPLPGQRITHREWLVREYRGRMADAALRGNYVAADAWRVAALIADLVLAAEPGSVDIDPTTR